MPTWIGQAIDIVAEGEDSINDNGEALSILTRYQSGERMMTRDANALFFHLVIDEGWSTANARSVRKSAVAFSHG
jgi:hypothetical protein